MRLADSGEKAEVIHQFVGFEHMSQDVIEHCLINKILNPKLSLFYETLRKDCGWQFVQNSGS